jgi:prolyl oligopeptidase PreP (S9A serine peptidase family)
MPAGTQQPNLYVCNGVNGQDRWLIAPEQFPDRKDVRLALQCFRSSHDNRYVACSLAASGSDAGVLHIFDMRTGVSTCTCWSKRSATARPFSDTVSVTHQFR